MRSATAMICSSQGGYVMEIKNPSLESGETRPARKRRDRSDFPVIDCDVHNEFTNYIENLLPYVDSSWRHYITNGGFRGVSMRPYAIWQGPDRTDTRTEDGSRGSAKYSVMQEQHLDVWNIEYAILTGPVTALSVNYLGQYDWAAALAKATNDWTFDNWLDKGQQVRGSIVVAAQHPEAAAREIDRCAEHPQVVQVILPT